MGPWDFSLLARHDISFFLLHTSLCFTLCWMEQGVKLLNNRNLYHLDDSESIILFSRVVLERNLVESFCVWFLSARDYSRSYSWKAPMNFVFTSLSFSPQFWFLCFRFAFFSHDIKTSCVYRRVKVTNFFRGFFFFPFFCEYLSRRTFLTGSVRLTRPGKVLHEKRKSLWTGEKENKFTPIHWAIIY